jgi:hypothetical protein
VGAGKILQVVNATYSTEVSSSSSTFADTGLTTTIAPTSSSSKILVMVNQSGCFKQTGNTILLLRLLRGATNLFDFERQAGSTASTTTIGIGTAAICYLDSPATTSAVTYKTQLASSANIAEVRVQTASGGTSSTSTITLMEVAV